MSGFAEMVHSRVTSAQRAGTLASNPMRGIAGEGGTQALAAGSRALQHLTQTNQACAQDERCHKAWQVLELAYQGSGADTRTALTQLQTLLRSLTEEDSDVAGDRQVQIYRRRLHKLLDH
jgi:hypothetical protein